MTSNLTAFLIQMRQLAHALAIGVAAAAAAGALATTLAAALGWMPWIAVPVGFGDAPASDAGPTIQVGATVLLLAMALVLPSSARVLRLEMSHRRFAVGMEDIARAYHAAHADDRRGVFRMGAEFDAVRERLAHLRQHPDLGGLEPDVLEVAAQMSLQSRRLAETYADEKVDRARRFLKERQEEVERSRELLGRAHHVARELRRVSEAVDLEESAVESQRRRLEADLAGLMAPKDGAGDEASGDNVVRITASGD